MSGSKSKREETPKKSKDRPPKQAKLDDKSSGKLTDNSANAMASRSVGSSEVNSDSPPTWFIKFEERLDARLAKLCDHFNRALEIHAETCDKEIAHLNKELERAFDKIDDLENRSRRNNAIFFGIPEGVEGNPSNCMDFIGDTMLKFIDPEGNLPKIDIQRAHRTPTGPPRAGQSKPRPIHVLFGQFQHKEMVRKAAIATFKTNKFRNNKLFIADDLSKRVQDKRKQNLPDFKKLQAAGKRPFFSYPAVLKFWDSGTLKIFKPTEHAEGSQ